MPDNPQQPDPQDGTIDGQPLEHWPDAPAPDADTEGMGEAEPEDGRGAE